MCSDISSHQRRAYLSYTYMTTDKKGLPQIRVETCSTCGSATSCVCQWKWSPECVAHNVAPYPHSRWRWGWSDVMCNSPANTHAQVHHSRTDRGIWMEHGWSRPLYKDTAPAQWGHRRRCSNIVSGRWMLVVKMEMATLPSHTIKDPQKILNG